MHGLNMEVETHLKNSAFHGNANFKINIVLERSVIEENSLENIEDSGLIV
jgi:hypothetical protein